MFFKSFFEAGSVADIDAPAAFTFYSVYPKHKFASTFGKEAPTGSKQSEQDSRRFVQTDLDDLLI
jgi:hypothetical protein